MPRSTPLAVRLAALVVVPAVLALGLWLVAGRIASSYWASIVAGTLWFVVASVLFGRVTKTRPALKPYVRGAFAATAAVAAFGFWWTSIRETTVTETVATGVPERQLATAAPPAAGGGTGGTAEAEAGAAAPRGNVQVAEGTVEAVGHSARGRAAVVRLADGGRVLTLRDFDIDPGPMVEVRLVAGDADDGADHVVLGSLKGTRGDQQYRVPPSADLGRQRTVVFWCIPFSQSLARARLRPS